MAEYRAYTVGDDGHFSGYEPLVCGDDAEAIELARRLFNGHDIELWCLERMVTRLAAITEKNVGYRTLEPEHFRFFIV
jgi:hypothetical protein